MKNDSYDEGSSDDEYEEDTEESSEENEELHCKNLDPSLAKLMGIIIEEQKEIDWVPPSKSGLDNSKQIIPSIYLDKHFANNIDYFKIIKDDIINYKTLSNQQLDYIKNMNNEEKFELIQLYNKLLKK